MDVIIGSAIFALGVVGGFFMCLTAFDRGWAARDNLGISQGESPAAVVDKSEYGGVNVLDGEKPKVEPAS